jgi:sortase (surface protein transpeptidase)
MRYQNPMSPSDPTAMMGQIAQYAQVEALTKLQQGQSIDQSLSEARLATDLIGKVITASDGTITETGKVISARFSATGPVLVLETGTEVTLSAVTGVNQAATPTVAPVATTTPASTTPVTTTPVTTTPVTTTPVTTTTDPTTTDPTAGDPTKDTPPTTGAARPAGPAALPRSRPVRVRIPAIGIDTTELTGIGVEPSGELEVPRGPGPVGWFTGAPTPGSLGPAVLAGHVSWNGAHGVFFRLGRLAAGDTVQVTRADGRTATFTVRAVRSYPKSQFPSADVYGNVDTPALRLITCAGDLDPATHRYADNVVVYADLTGVT